MSRLAACLGLIAALAACDETPRSEGSVVDAGAPDEAVCYASCSADGQQLTDCAGTVLAQCKAGERCNAMAGRCDTACDIAAAEKRSMGCEYYALNMDALLANGACFAVFVANTSDTTATLAVERNGTSLPMASFTRIPGGGGVPVSYAPYDELAGLPPGQVAILFLGGQEGNPPNCPVPSAQGATTMVSGTGIGSAFRITSDVPVAAYQMTPFSGGGDATTGASLLLATSAWDTSYVAVEAGVASAGKPSMNIVAMENYTTVTLLPKRDLAAGPGVPMSPAGMPTTITLQRGNYLQITQNDELTGSSIHADKPIGVFAGHTCLDVPADTPFCDHAEQMIPPVHALGSTYAAVMHRPRGEEPAIWRVVGAVDGTNLTYSSDVGAPVSLEAGAFADFQTGTPFVVRSQDADHPFMLFQYMGGSDWSLINAGGKTLGDPDFVLGVPSLQYANDYVLYADPTFPESSLVVVRRRDGNKFADVTLDCAGTLFGWQPIPGDDEHEWTRVSLSTGDYQPVGGCVAGRHEIHSHSPFAVWVWGWGSSDAHSLDPTGGAHYGVSYAYPAGMRLDPINSVL